MSEDGLSEPCDEPSMELFVESLTGTSFQMRVYPTDTVLDIKNKIFRVEGIPVPQQNLLFQMKELNDHNRLSDLGIVHGSTLRLVTAMRGGPISTRRWTSDHMVWKDLKDLIEHTREELGDKLGTKVSVLVFKEGEVIKWLRVIENEDGSYSPYTEQRAIAPPCSSSGGSGGGGGGGGCGVAGGAGSSVGSRSGSKHYQHHKTSATDAATMSSNTIDFQELMQFKQHASALSSYYHQQHHHHHNHAHHDMSGSGSSTVTSSSVGEFYHHQLQQHLQQQQHQQQQHQRQQVYRRLEDDVRMKGRVNMLKARMQRAKRNKDKMDVTPSEVGNAAENMTVAEEIAIGKKNDNLVLTAVLNDEFIDDDEEGIDEAFKPDLRLEALLRTLQNSESLVGVNGNGAERYTLAQRYHRRTHSRNSNMLQLDTSQLHDDDLTLFKPIPSGHGTSKHSNGSSATYLVGANSTASATNNTSTSSTTNNNSGLNLLLMDCGSASTAATVTANISNNSNSNSSGDTSNSSNNANDLEVALKEKHRSSRLRLHAAAAVVKNGDSADTIGKCLKNAVIGRRLSSNSMVDPTNGNTPINNTATSARTTPQSPPISLNHTTSANCNNYVCTNLHVFEPQHDVMAPGIRHEISPKRKGSKATVSSDATLPTAGNVASASGDCTRERLSLPETKRRAKIGRLLNTTTTPGSGETSDSDDGGLWSWQATSNTGSRSRHYRSTTKRLVLPDTTSADKGKYGSESELSTSLQSDQQHIILPDIWEHHGTVAAPPSPTNNIVRGVGVAGLLCARASTNATDSLVATTTDAADATDDNNGAAAAAACIRDYMDLDSEFDKMFSELRSAVPIPSIPSAIPPQYAPKDCQLYLGSPVVPRPAPTSSPTSDSAAVSSNKPSIMATTVATTDRHNPLGTLPYHVHGLCTSPIAGLTTRRSPLYHRRTTATAGTGAVMANAQTTDDDRTTIAAAARSMLEKVQRTAASEMSNVANTVGDKTVRQRRRRYSTDDCEFTLERLQNDYVPDRFDYSDFESYTADVDDMIGRYGQEAIVNARWMEAAAAAALSGTRSCTSPPQELPPPTTRHRNSVRLRTGTAAASLTDTHHLAEQIQRLGLGYDTDTDSGVTTTHHLTGVTSLSNSLGTRTGTTAQPGRTPIDYTKNTINTGEIEHSNFISTGSVPSCSSSGDNVASSNNNNTKLPTLIEYRNQHQSSASPMLPILDAVSVVAPTSRNTAPRMRCAHCNRKLNITNIYDCRCGRIFCAQHRYSEVHECAHDYKTEGRRLLAQQNPLVTAPKLAKF